MKTNSGFTLIEVLIAMLVLAVGLLGLAGLQATSLRNNQSAYYRSQATQLAYDLADRMRANKLATTTYTTGAASAKADCLTTTGCTSSDMAANDLFDWNAALTKSLPGGTGAVTIAAGVFTITVSWDDDKDGNDNNNPNFQTSFKL
ncbi:type IV pilus modification protein PilV [Methylobacter sp.]|uniref:type IV pilus modification protein PilV n=1 Tax=Methylobacter sp. TaxID=2051955 RepID=UPI002FDDA925